MLNRKSKLSVEFDREEDGRWIVEIPRLSRVMAHGHTKIDALSRVVKLARSF
jgi:predicted RNase H-like HicB family nuclease